MPTKNLLPILLALCAVPACGNAFAQGPAAPAKQTMLHIDVPTKLNKANVVIDVGHLVFNGDMPFFLGDVRLLASDLQQWRSTGDVVAIFHGDAAYLVLNDAAYDANRHVTSGNPFKSAMSELMAMGVHVELCGATAEANHWTHADLLPGVKVNLNAMVRLTQLEQEGYTLIYE